MNKNHIYNLLNDLHTMRPVLLEASAVYIDLWQAMATMHPADTILKARKMCCSAQHKKS